MCQLDSKPDGMIETHIDAVDDSAVRASVSVRAEAVAVSSFARVSDPESPTLIELLAADWDDTDPRLSFCKL